MTLLSPESRESYEEWTRILAPDGGACLAALRLPGCAYAVSDMRALPFPDRSLGLVLTPVPKRDTTSRGRSPVQS